MRDAPADLSEHRPDIDAQAAKRWFRLGLAGACLCVLNVSLFAGSIVGAGLLIIGSILTSPAVADAPVAPTPARFAQLVTLGASALVSLAILACLSLVLLLVTRPAALGQRSRTSNNPGGVTTHAQAAGCANPPLSSSAAETLLVGKRLLGLLTLVSAALVFAASAPFITATLLSAVNSFGGDGPSAISFGPPTEVFLQWLLLVYPPTLIAYGVHASLNRRLSAGWRIVWAASMLCFGLCVFPIYYVAHVLRSGADRCEPDPGTS